MRPNPTRIVVLKQSPDLPEGMAAVAIKRINPMTGAFEAKEYVIDAYGPSSRRLARVLNAADDSGMSYTSYRQYESDHSELTITFNVEGVSV